MSIPHRARRAPAARRLCAATWSAAWALTLAALPAAAQTGPPPGADEATGSAPAAAEAPVAEEDADAGRDALDRDTPRGSAVGYLTAAREGDYERAARYLDLGRLEPSRRAERGPELARELKVVLDRTLWVPVETLSQHPRGDLDDGLPADLEHLGTIELERGSVDVRLERVEAEDGTPVWKFSAATVARVPALYDDFGYGPLDQWLPVPFFQVRVLEILLWQWLALALAIFAAWSLSYVGARAVVAILRPLVGRTETDVDDRLFETALPPLRLLLAVALFWLATLPMGLAVPAREFFGSAERAVVLVGFAWLVMRAVDVIAGVLEQRLEARGQSTAVPLVSPGRRTAKFVLGVLAFVAILDNFGFNVTALVAGLGVGGIAVALAAQKSIEHLFGGIVLYADRPVRVGDFCRFGDKIGTIEEIGLRSTRVRTLDRTVVSVPNAEFSNLQLENFTARDFMRLYAVIGVRYETTPDQLRHLLVEVRRVLYEHPKVTNDPARIRFVGFGAYSLDLEIFAYVATADWNEFLGIREDVFLRIMDVVKAAGTGFAFPSQTLYLGRDDGLDAERVRAAESEVAAWRERGDLFIPRFPDEVIQELKGRHPWPPEGSPDRARSSG